MRLALPASYEALATGRRHDGDELRAARGVFFAALLGCGLWLAIAYCTWLIVR